MDPSDLDPEMASAMGFSSFGAQPSSKKRKYNNRADAVSSSSFSSSSAPAAATGANQVALAPRAPAAATATDVANTDEIALAADPADPAADEPADGAEQGEGGASLYADPAVAPALAHAQSLIDQLAARGDLASWRDESTGALRNPHMPAPSGLPQRPAASWGAEMGTAPTGAPQRDVAGGDARGGRGGRSQNQQPRGDGKPWWEGYYDPMSNEDPWRMLDTHLRGRQGFFREVGSTSKGQQQPA